MNGTNYTAAGILAALTPILPAGATATVAGVRRRQRPRTTRLPGHLRRNAGGDERARPARGSTNSRRSTSGFVDEIDKGGAVDNKAARTRDRQRDPGRVAPAAYTIPLRTPFTLTGSATDADNDPLAVLQWEQNDRGAAAGTTLLSNMKTNGPLFAMFPMSGQISATTR